MNNGGINWNYLAQMAQNRLQMATQPPITQPQLPQLSVIFVDGREGAEAYPLPPNCEGVPLFDRVNGALYIKSTDAYNKPTLVEYEPPVPKKSESDVQKELLVKMDERMTKIEKTQEQINAALQTIMGGAQNGREPDNGSFKKGKSGSNSAANTTTASTGSA